MGRFGRFAGLAGFAGLARWPVGSLAQNKCLKCKMPKIVESLCSVI
ncbi:hypothetical protein D3OALGA1CA_3410 [Olavius algarvensis associated proteobacterium Delta 3]|nr:hypothetical protein D3OALGA1CA_3410 [Olavius algarvensis associated proteobacterium Delta 3]